jgi:hypothetical protein
LNRELQPINVELGDLANGLLNTFIQRHDLYARQLDDGRYICIKRPLTQNHLISHLRGDITLGAYVLDQNNMARFIVFDGDDDTQLQSLIGLHTNLECEGFPSHLESSRRGGHLWIFLDQPISGKLARTFGTALKRKFSLPDMELFPKQDQVRTGPGSLVRLPFGVHRLTGKRYGFLNSRLEPMASCTNEQVRLLTHPAKFPVDAIARFSGSASPIHKDPVPMTPSMPGEEILPSVRIKASISAYEFISRYVKLSKNGHGLCPFHEDSVNSFAVSNDGNYWHCFAGCGGGSIIDFWMKYRNCDFKTAIRDLETIILNPK